MFDILSKLYIENPEAYEEMRSDIIERFIDDLPHDQQHRARGLQFQIDSKLNSARNPIDRYNKMVIIFWEGFNKLNDALNGRLPEQQTETAKILKLNLDKKS